MIMMPGSQEWVIIILLVLVLFGASKLPEVARNLGRAKVEFKKAEKEAEIELKKMEEELEKKEKKPEVA